MEERIAMIGAGNMARALIGGLLAAGRDPASLSASDPDAAARAAVRREFGIEVGDDNAAAAATAETVVIAVKPQQIDAVLAGLAPALRPESLLVSVAAGVPIARIQRALGRAQPVVRAMPNTPALLGAGATGLHASPTCSTEQRRRARALFECVGCVFEVPDEGSMDAVTAVSGSGPAYFFLLAEALAQAGEAAGLAPETARGLAAQTALGAGKMLAQGSADPATLRARVTSPGGTTAAALAALEAGGFAKLIQHAVTAAIQRGRELGDS